MAAPPFQAMTRACFDIGNYRTAYAPEYFRQNKHAFPESTKETAFQMAKNTYLDYFTWQAENPSLAADSQAWMTVKQQASLNRVKWFDVQGVLLDGLRKGSGDANGKGEEVVNVDIAGGEGHYLHAFNRKFPNTPGRRFFRIYRISLILGKGAWTYYRHWILHDWSYEEARKILTNIASAMEPGYSTLIINETIIPDRGAGFTKAGISIMMMLQVAARERT
ncbi:hypothetical protein BDV12DRAFT_204152 [Aspergillus spectabilis]